jgi:hypothetical protein
VEATETEPQIFTQRLKTSAPQTESCQPPLSIRSLDSKYPAICRFSMVIVGQGLWADKRECHAMP